MKILIINDVDYKLVELLKESGFSCVIKDIKSETELINIISDFHGIVLRGYPIISNNALQKASNLKFIARFGSGVEHIDVTSAKKRGIEIIRAPEALAVSVAEYTLATILFLLHKLQHASNTIRLGIWERELYRGNELTNRTIGIIGYGNTGSAFANLLRGFSVRILAYDKYKKNFGNDYVEEVNLETILRESDIISLHIPLNSETKNLVNESFLKMVVKSIVLINTSRGEVVNIKSLINSLKKNKIIGAILDVHEYEGLKLSKDYFYHFNETGKHYSYLCGHPNVILTPHIAGWTEESLDKTRLVLFNKIVALMLKAFPNHTNNGTNQILKDHEITNLWEK